MEAAAEEGEEEEEGTGKKEEKEKEEKEQSETEPDDKASKTTTMWSTSESIASPDIGVENLDGAREAFLCFCFPVKGWLSPAGQLMMTV